MQTKEIIRSIIIRARCTRQFIVYLATCTFQSIQNYLYKLSGNRLSGKVIVRETSCTGINRRVRARRRPGKIFPGNVLSGKGLTRETSVRESDCPGNVSYPLSTRSTKLPESRD